jgi:hypothetical protein
MTNYVTFKDPNMTNTEAVSTYVFNNPGVTRAEILAGTGILRQSFNTAMTSCLNRKRIKNIDGRFYDYDYETE